jgi:hypothetical protein
MVVCQVCHTKIEREDLGRATCRHCDAGLPARGGDLCTAPEPDKKSPGMWKTLLGGLGLWLERRML